MPVMADRRAVQTDADAERISPEEFYPFLIQERAVGLHGILYSFTGSVEIPLHLNRLSEKIKTGQQRLAAVPDKMHRIRSRSQACGDSPFKDCFAHPGEGFCFLLPVEAVSAAQIAAVADRLEDECREQRLFWLCASPSSSDSTQSRGQISSPFSVRPLKNSLQNPDCRFISLLCVQQAASPFFREKHSGQYAQFGKCPDYRPHIVFHFCRRITSACCP